MKFNVYYQSYTLAEVQGSVSDYFTVEKPSFEGLPCIAEAYGLELCSLLQERIACVICDSEDVVLNYFQVYMGGIIHPSVDVRNVFVGGKACLEDGKFCIEVKNNG